MPAVRSVCATASFAASINCSIIRSAVPRSTSTISLGAPFSSRIIRASSVSISSAPLRPEASSSIEYSSCAHVRLSPSTEYFSAYSDSAPRAITSFSSPYTPRSRECITLRCSSERTVRPCASICIIADTVRRSTPAVSEQIPFDIGLGSIGTTRSVTYTLVPRRIASRSSSLPGRT